MANLLTLQWIASAVDGRHTVLSGLSAWNALAYLAAGTDAANEPELCDVVGADASEAAAAAQAMLGALDASPATAGAAALWLPPDVLLTDWWRQTVNSQVVQRLTGDKERDVEAVNAWVAQATRGLIASAPASLDESTRLMLLAAIAVDTTWCEPFDGSILMPFHGPWTGRRVEGLARTTTDRDALGVTGIGSAAVTVVRVEGDGLVDVYLGIGQPERSAEDVLTATVEVATGITTPRTGEALLRRPRGGPGVHIGVAHFSPGPVLVVELPRFCIEDSHDMSELPAIFGLTSVSDSSRGHFSRLAHEPLAVGQAKQAAVAEFTELGFRAAAVTAVSMMAGGIPEPDPKSLAVTFDRPFGFVAVRRDVGVALVAGWIADVDDLKPFVVVD